MPKNPIIAGLNEAVRYARLHETCEHCRWWAPGAGRYGGGKLLGQCRVRAPVIKMLADGADRLVDDRGYWPVTGKDEFCSEFMKRAEG